MTDNYFKAQGPRDEYGHRPRTTREDVFPFDSWRGDSVNAAMDAARAQAGIGGRISVYRAGYSGPVVEAVIGIGPPKEAPPVALIKWTEDSE